MAWFSVGPSSYPDLKGKEQFTNSERIALQFLSMKVDFDELPSSKQSGAKLSVNEARRSRSRQQNLYANYIRTGYPVAAYPYTSRHDEVTRGNAIDVGVTMPDGTNRALNDAEFAWMHDQAEKRGFTWTGRNFGEPWHIEGATRTELKAPYPDARARVAGTPTPTPAAAIIAALPAEDDDMKVSWSPKGHRLWIGKESYKFDYLAVPGIPERVSGSQQLKLVQRLINSNQKKAKPVSFTDVETAILHAVMAQVKVGG